MDIAKYQELTGTTVPTSDQALVTAQIKRTRTMLETILGYPLCSDSQENLYNELGKTSSPCDCPDVADADLEAPDEVNVAYRLYSYNEKDEFFHVDPFTTLYKVKLVYVRPGEEDNGITLWTFDTNKTRVNIGRGGWSKYIEHVPDSCGWCWCECQECVQLAVDADWLSKVPRDLLYVWADMVTYYTGCKKDVKSESIQGHSYTKFDRILPEEEAQNAAILQRYAGPYGSITKLVTI